METSALFGRAPRASQAVIWSTGSPLEAQRFPKWNLCGLDLSWRRCAPFDSLRSTRAQRVARHGGQLSESEKPLRCLLGRLVLRRLSSGAQGFPLRRRSFLNGNFAPWTSPGAAVPLMTAHEARGGQANSAEVSRSRRAGPHASQHLTLSCYAGCHTGHSGARRGRAFLAPLCPF